MLKAIFSYILMVPLISFMITPDNSTWHPTSVIDTYASVKLTIYEPLKLSQTEWVEAMVMSLGHVLSINILARQPIPVQIHNISQTFNVKNYGAQGDGVTDDTTAIQKAVDDTSSLGGGTVYIPDGVYMIDPDVSIELKSNIKLYLSDNAILKAKPSANEHYCIVEILNVSNVSVVGGSIEGERYTHLRESGEGGMGIEVLDSSNVTITDISISDCWGDGIYIGTLSSTGYNNNIAVERFVCDNNRRHGVGVISVKNLTIRDGVCSNSNGGSKPTQSGLDLEPNYSTQILQNVLIENLQTINNGGYGLDFWLGNDSNQFPINNVSIIIRNHVDKGSGYGTLHDIQEYIEAGYNIAVM